MPKRTLGSRGLEVPAIGYGCMGLNIQLTEADMHEIESSLAKINIVGERASEGVLELLDIGNRGIRSSEGTHGISPLPAGKT